VDDVITLFNGRGGEYAARIERIHKDEVAVSIPLCRYRVRIAPAGWCWRKASRAAERMDYTLQKAVELGVAAIQPIAAKRSIVKLAGEPRRQRVAHWQGVVASGLRAMRAQSGTSGGCTLPLATGLANIRMDGCFSCRRKPRRGWPICPPDCHGLPWWLDPKAGSRQTKSPPCMQQVPSRSVWGPRAAHRRLRRLPRLAAMQTLWVISEHTAGITKPGACPA